MYELGIEDSVSVIQEHICAYKEAANRLCDTSTGRMSIHPVDKLRAKMLRERAATLELVLPDIRRLLDAEGSKQV